MLSFYLAETMQKKHLEDGLHLNRQGHKLLYEGNDLALMQDGKNGDTGIPVEGAL